MKNIARLWAKSQAPRKRTSRYTVVDGHTVLKQNMYSMADGEPSVFEREVKGNNAASSQNNLVTSLQRAGRDYDHQDWCQVCADGGSLVMCDWCPCAYHLECLGVEEVSKFNWSCPHHQCQTCGRKAHAVGGLLFRCEVCPAAFCEDDLPQIARDNITNRCERFVELGQIPPKQACFVLCSEACIKYHAATNGGRNPENAFAAGPAAVPIPRPSEAMAKHTGTNASAVGAAKAASANGDSKAPPDAEASATMVQDTNDINEDQDDRADDDADYHARIADGEDSSSSWEESMDSACSDNEPTNSTPVNPVLQEPLATTADADEIMRLRNLLTSGGAVPWKHVIETVTTMFTMDQNNLGAALQSSSPHTSRKKASFSQGLSLLKCGHNNVSLALQQDVTRGLIALLDRPRQARLKPSCDEIMRLRNLLTSGGAVPWKHVIETVKTMFTMDQNDLGAALQSSSPHTSRKKASFSQGLSLLKKRRKVSLALQQDVTRGLIALLDSRRQARLKQAPEETAEIESLTRKPGTLSGTGTKSHKAISALKHAPVRRLPKRSCQHAVLGYKDLSSSDTEDEHAGVTARSPKLNASTHSKRKNATGKSPVAIKVAKKHARTDGATATVRRSTRVATKQTSISDFGSRAAAGPTRKSGGAGGGGDGVGDGPARKSYWDRLQFLQFSASESRYNERRLKELINIAAESNVEPLTLEQAVPDFTSVLTADSYSYDYLKGALLPLGKPGVPLALWAGATMSLHDPLDRREAIAKMVLQLDTTFGSSTTEGGMPSPMHHNLCSMLFGLTKQKVSPRKFECLRALGLFLAFPCPFFRDCLGSAWPINSRKISRHSARLFRKQIQCFCAGMVKARRQFREAVAERKRLRQEGRKDEQTRRHRNAALVHDALELMKNLVALGWRPVIQEARRGARVGIAHVKMHGPMTANSHAIGLNEAVKKQLIEAHEHTIKYLCSQEAASFVEETIATQPAAGVQTTGSTITDATAATAAHRQLTPARVRQYLLDYLHSDVSEASTVSYPIPIPERLRQLRQARFGLFCRSTHTSSQMISELGLAKQPRNISIHNLGQICARCDEICHHVDYFSNKSQIYQPGGDWSRDALCEHCETISLGNAAAAEAATVNERQWRVVDMDGSEPSLVFTARTDIPLPPLDFAFTTTSVTIHSKLWEKPSTQKPYQHFVLSHANSTSEELLGIQRPNDSSEDSSSSWEESMDSAFSDNEPTNSAPVNPVLQEPSVRPAEIATTLTGRTANAVKKGLDHANNKREAAHSRAQSAKRVNVKSTPSDPLPASCRPNKRKISPTCMSEIPVKMQMTPNHGNKRDPSGGTKSVNPIVSKRQA